MKKISYDEKPKVLIELDAFLSDKSNESSLLFLKNGRYPSLYDLGIKASDTIEDSPWKNNAKDV